MSVGIRMKEIREFLKLKQYYVAELIDVSQQGYSALERDLCSPRIDTIKKFCNVMGIQLYYFLAFEVPVTQENMKKYASRPLKDVINEMKRMEKQIDQLHKEVESKGIRTIKGLEQHKTKAA